VLLRKTNTEAWQKSNEQTQQLDTHERNLTENKFFRKNSFNSNHKKTDFGHSGRKISDPQVRHTNARAAQRGDKIQTRFFHRNQRDSYNHGGHRLSSLIF
jgi:hypothetical protein